MRHAAYIEGDEFKWTLRPENSILKPALRPKFLSIFTPEISHPSHSIGEIVYCISFLNFETIWEDIILICNLHILLTKQ